MEVTTEEKPKCNDLRFCGNQLQEKCIDCPILKLTQEVAK